MTKCNLSLRAYWRKEKSGKSWWKEKSDEYNDTWRNDQHLMMKCNLLLRAYWQKEEVDEKKKVRIPAHIKAFIKDLLMECSLSLVSEVVS